MYNPITPCFLFGKLNNSFLELKHSSCPFIFLYELDCILLPFDFSVMFYITDTYIVITKMIKYRYYKQHNNMKTDTQQQKKVVLPSATVNELNILHNIFELHMELENEDELDIHYHRTINAICNLIREAGWDPKLRFSKTSKTSITLKKYE